MKNVKFPLPKRYWIYVSVLVVLAVLLFANIFITDDLTGEKEFGAFTQTYWYYFAAFLLTEIILELTMFVFAVKAGGLMEENNRKITACYDRFKYDGINPEDYDYIWFSFSGTERALIMKNGNSYLLYVERLDEHDAWLVVNTVSSYDSLETLKKHCFMSSNFSVKRILN